MHVRACIYIRHVKEIHQLRRYVVSDVPYNSLPVKLFIKCTCLAIEFVDSALWNGME